MSADTAMALDRREFVRSAGAVAAAVCLPVTMAITAPAVGTEAPLATLADWTVDDMWGVYPRPSEAIGYGRPPGDGEPVAAVHAADLPFIA